MKESKEEIEMKEYSYDDVKNAYIAIIKLGKAKVMFGITTAQHVYNLTQLDDKAKELYKKLMNDKSIHY